MLIFTNNIYIKFSKTEGSSYVFVKKWTQHNNTKHTHTYTPTNSQMWTKKKILLLNVVFHIHFVTIQIMLTQTLIGRSHIGLHQMLKTIKRVRRGRRGLSEQSETHTGAHGTKVTMSHRNMIHYETTSTPATSRINVLLECPHTNTHLKFLRT